MPCRPVALALVLLLTAVGARAQGDPAATPVDLEDLPVRPLTLTVSGGVSLGAYESGVNWALLYLLKMANEDANWTGEARPDSLDRYELVVATGASAGNINALMSSTEWARRDFTRRPPEQTLFWEAWVNVGMGQLLPEFGDDGPLVARADSEGTAALTRRYFDGPLRERLMQTLMPDEGDAFDPDVDVAVGLAITRVNPATEVLERSAGEPVGLRIRTQRAVAVYRLHSVPRAGDRAGHLFISHHDATRSPFADATRTRHWLEETDGGPTATSADCLDPGRLGQLVLPVFHADASRQDARANVNQAYRMTLASSAFPLAFEAVPITYVGERSPEGLAVGEYRTEPFLDGGVFDNNPLGLAVGLYEHVSSENTGCYQNPETRHRADLAWRHPLFVYIDPDDRRPESAEAVLAPANPGLATLGRFMSGVLPAARQQELELLARTLAPYQRDGLTITNRFAPVVGSTLGAFGSFTDPTFRQYDFYVGIYDGFHYVARQVLCARRDDGTGCAEEAMGELRRWAGLPTISPVADFIFEKLYQQEFGSPPPHVEPPDGAPLTAPTHPLAYEDRTMFNAVIEASEEMKRRGTESDFVGFIDALRARPGVRRIMSVWGETCRIARDSTAEAGGDPAAVTCRAEPYALAMIDRPDEWLFQFYEEVVERLRLVEDENPPPGEILLELAQLGVGSAREQQRRGFQWSTSSVPRRRGLWENVAHYALPAEIAAHFPSGRGVSMTYRPSWRLGRHSVVTFPITPLFLDATLQPADSLTGAPGRNTTAVRFALGPGLFYQGGGLFSRMLEVRALYTGSFTEGIGDQYAIGGEVATYFLAGKLRLAYQYPAIVHGGWDYDPPRWSFSIGLSDVNGLVYWLSRTLQ